MKWFEDLQKFVVGMFDQLPHCVINGEHFVCLHTISNSEEGYGHHYFKALIMDNKGTLYYGFSSGCSCDGSAGYNKIECDQTAKIYKTEAGDWEALNQKFDHREMLSLIVSSEYNTLFEAYVFDDY